MGEADGLLAARGPSSSLILGQLASALQNPSLLLRRLRRRSCWGPWLAGFIARQRRPPSGEKLPCGKHSTHISSAFLVVKQQSMHRAALLECRLSVGRLRGPQGPCSSGICVSIRHRGSGSMPLNCCILEHGSARIGSVFSGVRCVSGAPFALVTNLRRMEADCRCIPALVQVDTNSSSILS